MAAGQQGWGRALVPTRRHTWHERIGEPYYDGYSGLGQETGKCRITAAAMALRGACSRINITDNTRGTRDGYWPSSVQG